MPADRKRRWPLAVTTTAGIDGHAQSGRIHSRNDPDDSDQGPRIIVTTTIPFITLNNGVSIPQLGFGTFQIAPETTRAATLAALQVGYRHIDTAQMYGNERQVGQAVRESGLDRSEVFVTSKLSNASHGQVATLEAFERTLSALDLGYVDLFLIHWPMPRHDDYIDTWHAMAQLYESGRARSVGVSNFQVDHLRRLLDSSSLVPAVNQIEVHPFLTQGPLRAFNSAHGIATEAWSPIARGKILADSTIQAIARDHARTAAQVTLRWHLQRGDIIFPKSVNPRRMHENFEIFDFRLTEDEMASISRLDRGERTGPSPDEHHGVPQAA
jgi:2,5-diketo-D-gluconate reductase A